MEVVIKYWAVLEPCTGPLSVHSDILESKGNLCNIIQAIGASRLFAIFNSLPYEPPGGSYSKLSYDAIFNVFHTFILF